MACLLVLYVRGAPIPVIHDEFSYLLAADTFAAGRLTNPPHPCAAWFEAPHVLQAPTRQSKYPPAQGLALAAGQRLTGAPVAGAVACGCLAAAAVGWMLRSAASARTAMLAALAVALHPLLIQWSLSYWGGAVAAGAGALLLGAVWRATDGPASRRVAPALGTAAGAGLSLLALSRPYEGLVAAALIGVLGAARLRWTRARPPWATLLAGALPMLAIAAGFMLVYNHRVTGDPLTPPYVAYERQYAATPLLTVLAAPAPPSYRTDAMRRFYLEWERPQYERHRTARGFAAAAADKLGHLGKHALARSPAWGLWLLVAVAAARRDCEVRLLLGLLGVAVGASLLPLWLFAHYLAPSLALFVMAVVRGWPTGARRGAVVGAGLGLSVAFAIVYLAHRARPPTPTDPAEVRATIVRELRALPGDDLVVVEDNADWLGHVEFVYNDADLDGAAIVWARDLGDNTALLRHFASRRAWRFRPGGEPALVPYEPADRSAADGAHSPVAPAPVQSAL